AAACAELVMGYHVLEKGLTMPHRRLGFGKGAVVHLMNLVESFERRFGCDDPQVRHAVGVLRAYAELHGMSGESGMSGKSGGAGDSGIPGALARFLAARPDVQAAAEPHVRREAFFAAKDAPFPRFAASRHVVRHFEGPVPRETIEAAVELALTAPSACNRQHARVHVVDSPELRDRLFAMQGGTRGFGQDADKVIVVTADLSAVRWGWERHDCYINGGIFVMNLCYALHYHGVAHCILHWSVTPKADREAHAMLGIPPNEAIVQVIACGMPPEEFDFAASPRRALGEVMTWHGGPGR
ncbi:MAG: nitroreductase family protein, partial [Kiritimatiellae bacterium]|nr:nitroreductase family protein [Kiritimatiellia bacterium]